MTLWTSLRTNFVHGCRRGQKALLQQLLPRLLVLHLDLRHHIAWHKAKVTTTLSSVKAIWIFLSVNLVKDKIVKNQRFLKINIMHTLVISSGIFQWIQEEFSLDLYFSGTYFNDLSFREWQLFLSSIRIGWHGGRLIREKGHEDADLWGLNTTCRYPNNLTLETNFCSSIKYINRSKLDILQWIYTDMSRITQIISSNVHLMTTESVAPRQRQHCYGQPGRCMSLKEVLKLNHWS